MKQFFSRNQQETKHKKTANSPDYSGEPNVVQQSIPSSEYEPEGEKSVSD